MSTGAIVLVAACGSSGFTEFARQVQAPVPCQTVEECRVLRDTAAAYIAECFRSGGGPCTRESEVYDLASRHLNQATLRESPPPPPVNASGSATAAPLEAPPPPPVPAAAPVDPTAQRHADARLDAAIVDDCFSKLNAIVTAYEQKKSPSAEDTMSVVPSFNDTFHQRCGMEEKVRADARFAALLRRLTPIADKADDTAWARAKDGCMKASSFTDCSAALDFAKNNGSRHKKDAEQLAQTPHVQRLAQRWAAAQQAVESKRQEQCDRCMAVCRGNGTDNWDCQSKNCREFCL